MADAVVVKRVARRLEALSESTPKGEGFWRALAAVAADETLRAVTVQPLALPAETFAAALRVHEGLSIIATAPTLQAAHRAAVTFLEERGSGEVLLIEMRRLLGTM